MHTWLSATNRSSVFPRTTLTSTWWWSMYQVERCSPIYEELADLGWCLYIAYSLQHKSTYWNKLSSSVHSYSFILFMYCPIFRSSLALFFHFCSPLFCSLLHSPLSCFLCVPLPVVVCVCVRTVSLTLGSTLLRLFWPLSTCMLWTWSTETWNLKTCS